MPAVKILKTPDNAFLYEEKNFGSEYILGNNAIQLPV